VDSLFAQHEYADESIAGYARVIPERAVDRYEDGLTYAIPEMLQDLVVGERVTVPLGRGNTSTAGWVIAILDVDDIDETKHQYKFIFERAGTGIQLDPMLVDLARWISGYYCCPLGMVLATMVPGVVKRKKRFAKPRGLYVDLNPDHAESLVTDEESTTRITTNTQDEDKTIHLSPLQTRIVEELVALPESERPVQARALAARVEAKTLSSIHWLLDKGLLVRATPSRVTDPNVWTVKEDSSCDDRLKTSTPPAIVNRPVLTDEQAKAVGVISSTFDSGFSAHVLHGVTGSGKTEVYLRLIEQVLQRGKTAIVLVPEISLTPQTVKRFHDRFDSFTVHQEGKESYIPLVAVLHSALTGKQRQEYWEQIRSKKASIVVGARSAIFAPFVGESIGLIVVDEEHDQSYKQDQAPRYHARDVAVKRAHLAGAAVVLGSATPSLETYANAMDRKIYRWHVLKKRVPGLTLPKVLVVDLADERRKRPSTDRHVHLLGPYLESALQQTLDAGGQAMLFLNRRGYANYIACPDHRCGYVMACDHCDATMVYHKDMTLPTGGFVRCHHCLEEVRLPKLCPTCKRKINRFGLGTQRIEEELERKFPELRSGASFVRMDSDTMRGIGDYQSTLDRFSTGELRVLVGTQMIAKGLDFPNVRLVGVINADTAVNLPDFRAMERTFQLVAQVAGRSGRSSRGGIVIVQTFNPDLPAIRFAATHDYDGFAHAELEERRHACLPPIGRMVRIVVRHRDFDKACERSRFIANFLRKQLQLEASISSESQVWVRGPAPCPLSRIADYHRQSIEILSSTGTGPIQRLITDLRNAGIATSDGQTAIDVDPMSLL